MLRRWGAAEAIRQVVPAPLRAAPAAGVRWTRGICLGGLAAAAALLVIGPLYFAPTKQGSSPQLHVSPLSPPSPSDPDKERIRELERQLAEVRKTHQAALAERDELLAERAEKLIAAGRELALLRERTKSQLARVRSELAALRDQAAGFKRRQRQLEAQLEAAKREFADASEASVRADVARRRCRVENELAWLRARHAVMQAGLIWPDHARPQAGPASLADRQSAAQLRGALDQCARLRSSVDKAHVGVVDRIEVVLLRLAMLDAKDSVDVKSFEDLLARGGLIRLIDETLDSPAALIELRTWLYEVRMILLGVDRVG